MPEKHVIENQAAWDYATYNMHESRLLPLELLRCHGDMDISERDTIRLLRLLAYCYDGSKMRLEEVMSEFQVNGAEACAILRPYVEMRLLEWNGEGQYYSCQGLRRELYLHWVNVREKAAAAAAQTDLQGLTPPSQEESEEIRALAHLYRRFEQELGRPLRYAESDRLRSWAGDEGHPPQLVEEALKRASLQGKCTLAYIGSILSSWQKKKLTTLEMVLAQDVKPEAGAEKSRVNKKSERGDKSDKYAKVSIN